MSDVETSDANLTYTIVSGPTLAQGTLTPDGTDNGLFSFDSAPNFNGTVLITFNVTDRGDPDDCIGSPPACDGVLTSSTKTFTITVNPVNDAPTASDGSASQNEDAAAIPVDLRTLVSDVETSDANLTYTIVSGPTLAQGTLTPDGTDNGLFSFDSAPNFNGTVLITFNVTDRGDPDDCIGSPPACDGVLTSSTKTFTITVNPVNDAPTASDGSASQNEDAAAIPVDLRTLVSDVETSDAEPDLHDRLRPDPGPGHPDTGRDRQRPVQLRLGAELQRHRSDHLQRHRPRRPGRLHRQPAGL